MLTSNFAFQPEDIIEINGVGSRYDWLEIFRTIVAVKIGFLAVLGLETLISIFKRKK